MAKTFTLTRTRDADGKVYEVPSLTLRGAQQQVAWCCTDNAGMTRRDASAAAGRLTPAGPLSAGGYTFTLTAS